MCASDVLLQPATEVVCGKFSALCERGATDDRLPDADVLPHAHSPTKPARMATLHPTERGYDVSCALEPATASTAAATLCERDSPHLTHTRTVQLASPACHVSLRRGDAANVLTISLPDRPSPSSWSASLPQGSSSEAP